MIMSFIFTFVFTCILYLGATHRYAQCTIGTKVVMSEGRYIHVHVRYMYTRESLEALSQLRVSRISTIIRQLMPDE